MFNLLDAALTLIPGSSLQWIRETGRTTNDLGQWVTTYAQPISIDGSFQPLDQSKYEALGLDLNKHYYVLYGSHDLLAVDRDRSGGIIVHNGRRYHIDSNINWFDYNGWKAVICVDIGKEA